LTSRQQGDTTTTVTSNRNPSVSGQTVTFTAGSLRCAADGTVTIVVDGVANGPFALERDRPGHVADLALSVGTHAVTAYYDGSANYNTSNSVILTQTCEQGGVPDRGHHQPAARPTSAPRSCSRDRDAGGTGQRVADRHRAVQRRRQSLRRDRWL
jgi:hypothetical protein